ncbi:hypothetical protein JQ615_29815 [Bradyrhizobium jicamae]|uniref:T3SS negative regulator,GrlR n=2 Tax=Bradyrhizobium jicamae TaxID=280332 RepID=A0ABS5FRY3_9BRAD|nr:hypothetical protein [Bradyrhizobium jicamae]MBR0937437.1 hypothetical protein [Bradyrhizobium jicamae]
MLRDGQYAAWFRTPRGEGTGIVRLADGKISGGDTMFAYGGTYEVDDNNFTATLTTRRFAESSSTTVFGCDEVEARLTGRFNGTTAVCWGAAKEAPGIRFEATLFLQQQELPTAPGPTSPPPRGDLTRLPQTPHSRRAAKQIVTRLT